MEGVIYWPPECINFSARPGYAVFGGQFIPRVTFLSFAFVGRIGCFPRQARDSERLPGTLASSPVGALLMLLLPRFVLIIVHSPYRLERSERYTG